MSDPIRWSPIMTPSPGGTFVCNHDYAMLEKERDDLHARVAELEAALAKREAVAVPEGFVMVPVEPTEDMIHAGSHLQGIPTYNGRVYRDSEVVNIYKDMLAASQQAAKGEGA